MPIRLSRIGRAGSLAALVFLVAAATNAALFPEPVHIVREIHDSISGTTTTVEQYAFESRVVIAANGQTSIVDYAREEVIEIDRRDNTFSITSFADLARGAASTASHGRQPSTKSAEPRALARKTSADGRVIEQVAIARGNAEIIVGVDPSVQLSPRAVEALIGAAYPNQRALVHEAVLRAVAYPRASVQSTGAEARVPFPSEWEIRQSVAGELVSLRSTMVRIDRALAPPELLAVPAGAARVDSRTVSVPRAFEEIEGRTPVAPRR